jgi:hypothetical protein
LATIVALAAAQAPTLAETRTVGNLIQVMRGSVFRDANLIAGNPAACRKSGSRRQRRSPWIAASAQVLQPAAGSSAPRGRHMRCSVAAVRSYRQRKEQ